MVQNDRDLQASTLPDEPRMGSFMELVFFLMGSSIELVLCLVVVVLIHGGGAYETPHLCVPNCFEISR